MDPHALAAVEVRVLKENEGRQRRWQQRRALLLGMTTELGPNEDIRLLALRINDKNVATTTLDGPVWLLPQLLQRDDWYCLILLFVRWHRRPCTA